MIKFTYKAIVVFYRYVMNFILCTFSIRLFRPLEGMESRSILLRNVSIGMHVLIFLYLRVNMLQFSNPPPVLMS